MVTAAPTPHLGRPLVRQGSTAYGAVAARLRAEIADGRYPDGVALPTEAELCELHGVSRQTVRRAFQDLVAEDLVYRIPGRGTFVSDAERKYIRSSGSIEELMSLSEDTDLDVLSVPTIGIDIEAAGRLHLESDTVVSMRFRRLHLDRPYCVTAAYLPVSVGRGLLEVPELSTTGVRRNMTVLSVVRWVSGRTITGADQMITAVAATPEIAESLECAVGDPVMRIDRLYFDEHAELLELAINHFNPARYTYRCHIRSQGS
jgi:DNA-binding GntR family transcriptional regulator